MRGRARLPGSAPRVCAGGAACSNNYTKTSLNPPPVATVLGRDAARPVSRLPRRVARPWSLGPAEPGCQGFDPFRDTGIDRSEGSDRVRPHVRAPATRTTAPARRIASGSGKGAPRAPRLARTQTRCGPRGHACCHSRRRRDRDGDTTTSPGATDGLRGRKHLGRRLVRGHPVCLGEFQRCGDGFQFGARGRPEYSRRQREHERGRQHQVVVSLWTQWIGKRFGERGRPHDVRRRICIPVRVQRCGLRDQECCRGDNVRRCCGRDAEPELHADRAGQPAVR